MESYETAMDMDKRKKEKINMAMEKAAVWLQLQQQVVNDSPLRL